MAKPRKYGYFKPFTPNCRALCPKKVTAKKNGDARQHRRKSHKGDNL